MSVAPWIQTAGGRAFDLLAPQPEQVDVRDVAHHLARICRYTGAVVAGANSIYSDAQHCVYVSYACDLIDAADGLMHDAPEAYHGDCSAPMKSAMRIVFDQFLNNLTASGYHDGFPARDPYAEVEERCTAAVQQKFGLRFGPWPKSVVVADQVLLATERRDLMNACERDWKLGFAPVVRGALVGPAAPDNVLYQTPIRAWSIEAAEGEFLRRYRELFTSDGKPRSPVPGAAEK